ncbi:glycosyltransferase family 4 protein [Sphingomonas sp.]|uniref:glycosyltransferase family 4 protein n=1 Tax=Sphingomonas sp. TaxID=28214 RepID=UPI001810BA48|nr:glycosyltransferase family 4 protein [Sphingomonas sp.]MBA3511529.1 glycosyltransferase family 4 protein [Sphingomonas sp.]
MKVVHFVPSLVKGGGERAVVDLSNWQIDNGHQVTVVAGWKVDESLLRHQLDERVDVVYITESGTRWSRYLAGVSWLLRNRKWVFRQDLIHAHMTWSAVLATLIYYWRRSADFSKPFVFETYHAVGMPISRMARWVHSRMAKRRDVLILMADDAYWSAFRAAHPTLDAEVILNGLAQPRIAARKDQDVEEYRQSAGAPDSGSLIVGSIGRLVAERRPELVIHAFAKIAEELEGRVHLLFAGAGPQVRALRTLVQEYRLEDRVHFPGLALDPALPLALTDVYISVNVGPVTGLAAVQAAFCGVPIVGIQLVEDYRPAQEDWIWSSTDIAAVAAEVTRLLEDPDARSALGASQRAYAYENLTIDRMGRSYELLYDRARARRGLATGSN